MGKIIAKIENQKAILGTLAKSRENNEFLITKNPTILEVFWNVKTPKS